MLINSPLKPSLLQGKETQVPQFLHACQMLKSLDIFVSLCWACFTVFMSFFYRASAVLNREEPSSPSTCWLCCSRQPGMLLAFFAGLMFNLLSTKDPQGLLCRNSLKLFAPPSPPCSMYWCAGLFFTKGRNWHLLVEITIRFLLAHFCSL